MDLIKTAQAVVSRWLDYVSQCAGAELHAPACTPFWTWIAIGATVSGLLAVIWALAKLVSYKLKVAAALRAEETRMRVADANTMENALWEGERAYPKDEGGDSVEFRIRAALAKRKKEGHEPPVV